MTKKRKNRKRITSYPIPKTCLYCNSDVIYTSNKEVYGRIHGNGKCYKCTNCDAYVGVHTGTNVPLGRLADKKLRKLKIKAHSLFDPLWKNGGMKRGEAYHHLAKKLGIPKRECHFGWFDETMLLKAIEVLQPEIPKQSDINLDQLLKEIIEVLKKEPRRTDEWGRNFIVSLLKTRRAGKTLTDKQVYYLGEQHKKIMKNEKMKRIDTEVKKNVI